MCKKIFIGILLIFIFAINDTIAQTSKQYRVLLTNNKNDLFPKVLIYDAPNLPISYQDYIRLGFDYISSYSLVNSTNVPNRYKYILWTGDASNDAKADLKVRTFN